jgi:hypothetical protein
MINNIYTYRKVQGVIRNRGDQVVANATVALKCFDGDGKPLGASEFQCHNVEAGGMINFSEDVQDGTCSVKVASVGY